MLELVKIRFKAEGTRLRLALFIKDEDEKLVILDSRNVPKREADLLRSRQEDLQNLSLGETIGWLRKHAPYTYTHAYRTVQKEAVEIVEKIKLPKLIPPSPRRAADDPPR